MNRATCCGSVDARSGNDLAGSYRWSVFGVASVVFSLCREIGTFPTIRAADRNDAMLDAVGNPLTGLSDRERVVAAKFAEGMTYREIGETLFIAPTTVRTHLSVVYRKLGVRSKVALASLLSSESRQESGQARFEGLSPGGFGPPVIAVLPFENLSSDERWGRLADGLSADIIVDLARYSALAVIARQTMLMFKGRRDDLRSIGRELNADYLLEGSLQATGEQFRISVQLVDVRSGAGLWAARYDQSADNLFATQDMVTENVVNVLVSCCGKLAHLGRDVIRRKPPASLGAYDYYLLGVEQHNVFTRTSNVEAIRLLSRAVELDPGLARAWLTLGFSYAVEAWYASNPSVSLERWYSCMEQALLLDPGDSMARQGMADIRAARGDLGAAAEELDRALAAAPNDADTLAMIAGSRALVTGDPQQGCVLIQRALRLNPLASLWYFSMLGRTNFVVGRYRESVVAFQQSPPDSPATLLFQSMGHAMLDEVPQAAKIAARLASEFPGFTVEGFIRTYPVTNPPALVAIREGARRAGLR
ncbi:LuxR C-terminal-related transcriptional regulator [Mesorhizobium sp. M0306]|uniref:LuxR C-terminal-related transcriptional regulator n=1 Tax=Mesorhizobium sp. M0306 TaxID=2956932 RepID=UPI00333C98CD